MHWITLRFINKELETKYQEYYVQEQIQYIQQCLKQYIVLCFLCMIAFYVQGLYYSSGFYLITISGSIGFYQMLKIVPAYLTLGFFNMYHFVAIVAYWLAFWLDTERSLEYIVHYCLFTIFLGLTFIFTENILLAICQMLFYVFSCVFAINYYIQSSILQMILIPIIGIWFFQFRTKIKRKRLLFQQSQVNESICMMSQQLDELIKQTTKDEFFLFSFNQDESNYYLNLTNKHEFYIIEFVNKFIVGSINLSTFLHRTYVQRNHNKIQSQVINGFYSNGKTPQKYYLYVQTYPKLMFYMRFIPQEYKPKQMFIYHHQIMNNFFTQIDKLRKQYSLDSIIELINKVKVKFYLQMISATLDQYSQEPKSIFLAQLLKHTCLAQNLEIKISGRAHIKSNFQLIHICLSALISIIKRFNEQAVINISNSELCTQINFKFEVALSVDRILQSQYFCCLTRINTLISIAPIKIEFHTIMIVLMTNQDMPFTELYNSPI